MTTVSLGKRQMKRMMKRSRKMSKTKKKIKSPINPDRINQERIIGGSEVNTKEKWRWIVHLPDVGCGGTIISHNWVLTAAHCCHGVNPWRYKTVSNTVDISLVTGEENVHYPVQIIKHPDYNATTFDYDFCLLRYDENLIEGQTGSEAGPDAVCLPATHVAGEQPGPGIQTIVNGTGNCFVAGWGLTDADDPNSSAPKLQEVAVEILNSTTCNATDSYNGTLFSSMFCAGSFSGGFDSCQGDSGGPLICEVDSGTTDATTGAAIYYPYLEGIVSFGQGCAEENKPGIYGAVDTIVDWIYSVADSATVVNSSDAYHNETTYHTYDTADTQNCGTTTYVGYSGTIALPTVTNANNETVYRNNLQCTYTIRVPTNMIVQLNITRMDIEDDDECKYDRLQIINGNQTMWMGKGRYGSGRNLGWDEDYFNWYDGEEAIKHSLCGNGTSMGHPNISAENPIQVQAKANEMTVIFISDLNVTAGGWEATFEAVAEEKRFDNNCGVPVTNGRNGTFASPLADAKKGTPDTYPPNSDCQWVIDVGELQNGEIVEVSFEHFDIEDNGQEDKPCPYDYLEVSSADLFGNSNTDDTRKLCGAKDPGIISFTQRQITFKLFSDETTQKRGFKLNWNVKSTIIKIYNHQAALSYTGWSLKTFRILRLHKAGSFSA